MTKVKAIKILEERMKNEFRIAQIHHENNDFNLEKVCNQNASALQFAIAVLKDTI